MSSDPQGYALPKMTDHLTILVHTFHHGLPREKTDRGQFLKKAVEHGWRSSASRERKGIKSWTPLGDGFEDFHGTLKGFFHPPTLEALYPEMYRLENCSKSYGGVCKKRQDAGSCPEGDKEACRSELAGQLLKSLRGSPEEACSVWSGIKEDDVVRLHLTNNPESGQSFPSVWLFGVQGQKPFPVEIEWVEAYLFSSQVGFLCCKATLHREADGYKETNIERLVQFWQLVRDFRKDRTISLGNDTEKESRPAEELPLHEQMEKWISPLKGGHGEDDKWEVILAERSMRLKIFSFISLTKDDPEPEWWEKSLAEGYYQGVNRLDMLLYEVSTTTLPGSHAGQDPDHRKWHPSRDYLIDQLLNNNRISIWRFWRGMALKDLVAFLSIDGTRQPGPFHYEELYFPLYIYVYNLKMQLFRFSTELNLRRLRGMDEKISRIIEEFYLFRSEFWFSEISPNFQMAILFDKFKFGLELQPDYEGALAEIGDSFNYQETQHSKREAEYNKKLNRMVTILTVGAFIVGFWGMNALESFGQFANIVLCAFAGILFAGLAWASYSRFSGLRSFVQRIMRCVGQRQ